MAGPKAANKEFKPNKPIWGDLKETKADFFTAWTGGKPNLAGDDLDATAKKHAMTPTQFRPILESSSAWES
jgi:hypothetical protein